MNVEPDSDEPTGRAIAFDLDGILIDGMPFHIEAWQYAFREHGVQVTAEELYLLEGIKSREVVDHVCASRALALPDRVCVDIVRAKRKQHQLSFRPLPISGAQELVRQAYRYGYFLVLVTGTFRDIATEALQALGVQDAFRGIIATEDTSRGKPSPEPYRAAATLAQVTPQFCLALENAPAGIASAKAAGLACVGIATYLAMKHLSSADKTFATISACADWLESEHRVSGGKGPWTNRAL